MGFTDREILTISSLTDNNKSEQRTLLVRKKKYKEGRGRKRKEEAGECKVLNEILAYLNVNRYICTYALCASYLAIQL